jgi:transcriptional regulator with XRE-family HTH domain
MRYYSHRVTARVKAGPNTLGLQLARLAILRGLSVKEVAYLLGAARMTVYNWYSGKQVTNAYTDRVQQLINILKAASNGDAAWSAACKHFNRQT